MDYISNMFDKDITPKKQHGFYLKLNCCKPSRAPLCTLWLDWKLWWPCFKWCIISRLYDSKCFDKVCHRKLIHNYLCIVYLDRVTSGLKIFLQIEYLSVKVNNSFSPAVSVLSGVPQGTVIRLYGSLVDFTVRRFMPSVAEHSATMQYVRL